jgi:hypothetical protein
MLGSHALFIPGVIVLTLGATLQAAATGAVKTVKMSVKLVVPNAEQKASASQLQEVKPLG